MIEILIKSWVCLGSFLFGSVVGGVLTFLVVGANALAIIKWYKNKATTKSLF